MVTRVGIEDDHKRPSLSAAFSRRPLLLVGGVGTGLAVLAIMLSFPDEAASAAKSSDEEGTLVVPDQTSADRVNSLAASAPDAAIARNVDEENLGTTNKVPQLPSDATGTYLSTSGVAAQHRALDEQFALQEHRMALEARLRGQVASMQLESWASIVPDPARETRDALALLGGGQDPFSNGEFGSSGGGGLDPMSLMNLSAAASGAAGRAGELRDLVANNGSRPDPNLFAEKADFFKNGGKRLEPGQLDSRVVPSRPYELVMQTVIPGILITAINSDTPGTILGQVSENVYDTATGNHLLIPSGSRLVGIYNFQVSQGQNTVQIAWVRLNFPNGSKLDLGGMPGADQAGRAGLRDRVNHHFGRRLAAALMASTITVGYEVTAPRNGSLTEGAVHRGLGESILQQGVDLARENGQIPPTIEIRAGARFAIICTKDIVFDGPYSDGIPRRKSEFEQIAKARGLR